MCLLPGVARSFAAFHGRRCVCAFRVSQLASLTDLQCGVYASWMRELLTAKLAQRLRRFRLSLQ